MLSLVLPRAWNQCADTSIISNIESIEVPSVLRTALSLASPAQGDKVSVDVVADSARSDVWPATQIHVNGLRAIGSLLKVVSPSASPALTLASLDEAAETLCCGLRTGSAKVSRSPCAFSCVS